MDSGDGYLNEDYEHEIKIDGESQGVREVPDEHVQLFYDNLELMKEFIRETIHRKVLQRVTVVQTDSSTISNEDVASQTVHEDSRIYDAAGSESEIAILPDLDDCIANLRISIETQTDITMEDFGSPGLKLDQDKVIIVYRNPRILTHVILPITASITGVSLLGLICYTGIRLIGKLRS